MKKQNNDTIRAHFIRSVLCVLLLLAVCTIPFALAQSRSHGNISASAATAVRNSDGVSNAATAPHTGGRYNPLTDTWTATTTTNAPSGRYDHTAVWIGS